MDPRRNPYTPGAGTMPPALAGRTSELESFDIQLSRLCRGTPSQCQIVTGLRGMGKTVLLNEFQRIAEAKNWIAIEAEVEPRAPLAPVMVRLCRKALYSIDGPTRWKERARRAAAVLKSFTIAVDPQGGVQIGSAGMEPAAGLADTGVLGDDLTDVLLELGAAAQEKGTGIVFLMDEIQFLAASDLSALIVALHKCMQKSLPVTFVGAGLPQVPGLAGEAKSYAERLFVFPVLGRLSAADAMEALQVPARALGVEFDTSALSLALDFTEGYPYFLQEVGSSAWILADGGRVMLKDMEQAVEEVRGKLDRSFFKVRIDRCTDLERAYLRAMAEIGPGPRRSGEIATTLGYSASTQLGPTRASLIKKGLIYTPDHGMTDFTVPQFDSYLRRAVPFEVRRPSSSRRSR